jgi:RimJ/RimL family protein N-acetyltransferase
MDAQLMLRPVGEPDLDALLAVYRDCEDFIALGSAAAASEEMIRGDLESSAREGGTVCGVFAPEGEMIGVADFVPGNFRGQPEKAYLALLMLKKNRRGKGNGAQALALIETAIRKDPQVRVLRLGVLTNNPRAIRFWRNHGFETVSGPETLADGKTVYRMEKKL